MIPTSALASFIATRTGQGTEVGSQDRARWTRCRDCRAWLLTGLDDDVMALTARVDPTPLDRVGEVEALIAGRPTYRLHLGPKPKLRRRDRDQIAGTPAEPDLLVLPAHRCGQPLAPALTMPRRHQEAASARVPF